MGEPSGRPLRADAERSVRAILEAAERVLAADPGASMEQIAEAAGVARTTVHRRFASRQALIEALAESAVRQLAQAVEDGRPDTAPPLVALHRITANVLRIKGAWSYALGRPTDEGGGRRGGLGPARGALPRTPRTSQGRGPARRRPWTWSGSAASTTR